MSGKAMCSLMQFTSRTECQASRISLCFHFVDRSMISTPSRSISYWRSIVCWAILFYLKFYLPFFYRRAYLSKDIEVSKDKASIRSSVC